MLHDELDLARRDQRPRAPRHRRAGQPAHVINLTLLPLNPADREALELALHAGPVAMLSRGFGNCHISSTGTRNVWRVQYFNNAKTLILDTIEIIDLHSSQRTTLRRCIARHSREWHAAALPRRTALTLLRNRRAHDLKQRPGSETLSPSRPA